MKGSTPGKKGGGQAREPRKPSGNGGPFPLALSQFLRVRPAHLCSCPAGLRGGAVAYVHCLAQWCTNSLAATMDHRCYRIKRVSFDPPLSPTSYISFLSSSFFFPSPSPPLFRIEIAGTIVWNRDDESGDCQCTWLRGDAVVWILRV